MLNWLIIGGGIHGTYLSNLLLRTRTCSYDEIMILDPNESLLFDWNRCTENTCMTHLRSPVSQNLDTGKNALLNFAKERARGACEFEPKYWRPSVKLFSSHCNHVIERERLHSLLLKGRANAIKNVTGGYKIESSCGDIQARNVLLALGSTNCLSIPEWAERIKSKGAAVYHVLANEYPSTLTLSSEKFDSPTVVIGAGLSAAQVAMGLATQKKSKVILLHRANLRTREFDADPCWMNGHCLQKLLRHDDYENRRRIVDHTRMTGTIPEYIKKRLLNMIKAGEIELCKGEVVSARIKDNSTNGIELLTKNNEKIECNSVVLATGFEKALPGGNLIKNAIDELALPVAPCGYPIVDKFLQWQKNLFVSGPLAELEIGAGARNIAGARIAGSLILRADSRSRPRPKEHRYYAYTKRHTH